MIEFLRTKLEGKNILILGYGREGESTFHLLKRYFPEIHPAVADINENIQAKVKGEGVKVYVGKNYLSSIKDYDLIFKTPGISLNHLDFEFDKNTITSQTDLFLEFYHRQVMGITGTKGKSTTSSLVYHILKSCTDNTVFVGNIGIPPFDLIGEINHTSKIVFELSSHQLEFIHRAPHISVLLNIFQEHLDHYKSFDDYKLSKLNILKYQDVEDFFIYNADDKNSAEVIPVIKSESKKYSYSLKEDSEYGCFVSDKKIIFLDYKSRQVVYDLLQERDLKGDHNVQNIMAAVCACRLSGIPSDVIVKGINTFKGLEHRIEYVGTYGGIRFYNDSIATIPEACIEALKTLKDVETLIVGGYDRGIDYSFFAEYLAGSSVKNILFLGEAGKRIYGLITKEKTENSNMIIAKTLEEAVLKAKEKTGKNGICLLSPAAASYDSFKNFEERGEVYKKIVRSL